MLKILSDTLKNTNGKYSRKSLTTLASFVLGICYEFILPFFQIETKQYVFETLMLLSGGVLISTIYDKTKNKNE